MSEDRPVALVTGASRGLGRAIAIDFGQRGYHVIVNYRSEEGEAEQTASTIRQTGAPPNCTRQMFPVQQMLCACFKV